MPASSKAQQQAAGAALAAKEKGTTAGLKGASKQMAKMSTKELEKIASTKHKGLPKHVKESVEEGQVVEASPATPHLIKDLEFWVVEKAPTPDANPMDLVFKTNPVSFALQVRGGLNVSKILGFYLDEDEAMNAAHDEVTAVFESAKALEEKKVAVTSKIEETIKKLQKEVNRCMEEGDDQRAQMYLEKISQLRSKGQMVEASKQPIEEKKNDLNEGWFDRLKANIKGTGSQASTTIGNLGAYLKGKKDAIKDPILAKNMAILQQKAKTLSKELDDVSRDISKLFPGETLEKAPAEFKDILGTYVNYLEAVKTYNTKISQGDLTPGKLTITSKGVQSTGPTQTTQTTTAPAPASAGQPQAAPKPAAKPRTKTKSTAAPKPKGTQKGKVVPMQQPTTSKAKVK